MVAILDKREGKAVHAILKELARTYPQVSEVLAADAYVSLGNGIVKDVLRESVTNTLG